MFDDAAMQSESERVSTMLISTSTSKAKVSAKAYVPPNTVPEDCEV